MVRIICSFKSELLRRWLYKKKKKKWTKFYFANLFNSQVWNLKSKNRWRNHKNGNEKKFSTIQNGKLFKSIEFNINTYSTNKVLMLYLLDSRDYCRVWWICCKAFHLDRRGARDSNVITWNQTIRAGVRETADRSAVRQSVTDLGFKCPLCSNRHD